MKKIIVGLALIGGTVIFVQSCQVNGCSHESMSSNGQGVSYQGGNGNGNNNNGNQNQGGGDGSDRMGGNCMSCHGPNGGGSGCFTIGGTVFDSTLTLRNPYAYLQFYTGPNGTGQLVATLDADGSGNFYTTDVINFGNGLYPVIVSKINGKTLAMPSSTVNGACNSCHGISNAKIWIN